MFLVYASTKQRGLDERLTSWDLKNRIPHRNLVLFPGLSSPIQIKMPQTLFIGKIIWNILYKNLGLKGGVQGERPLPGPCTPPFKIQMFV